MIEQIQYRLATTVDTEILIHYRLLFLSELFGKPKNEEALRLALKDYFVKAITDNTCVCWLATTGNKIAGIGAMTIWQRPGNFRNPSGRTGYILNMYTLPHHRKKGICNEILKKLIASGKEMDVISFELYATKDGEPLYRKYGFGNPVNPALDLVLPDE